MNVCHDYVRVLIKSFGLDEKYGKSEGNLKAMEAMAEEFNSINWAESDRLSRKYSCLPKQCFDNCAKIAALNSELTYCEGYGLSAMPMPHSWLVNRAGNVIDPTWCLTRKGWIGPWPKPDYFGVRIVDKKIYLHHGIEPSWLSLIDEKGGTK